ncbi:MAG TPA: LytR C-terminal domain-containing protein [Gemmatimonadaceae bacterium]|nr:LytR C-terminal domain-containing protein [Gemmatimonadaceae bacterium]
MSDRSRTLRRAGIVATGVLILAGAAITTKVLRNDGPPERAPAPDVNDTSRQRIRVQVLNATTTRGLARRVTLLLRDRGFDVVEMGTSPEPLDSTTVLDRSGHPDRARRVADALGGARVESRPDSSRYLDVTVLVGRSFRPPAEPFYP